MPFYGYASYRIRNQLLSLFKTHFPQIDIKIVLPNKHTIGSCFPVKERLPESLCSNVVYHYKCAREDCMSSYVGSTERALQDRISEHMGVSFRTGINLTSPSFSSIREHSQSCSHPITSESFQIIINSTILACNFFHRLFLITKLVIFAFRCQTFPIEQLAYFHSFVF